MEICEQQTMLIQNVKKPAGDDDIAVWLKGKANKKGGGGSHRL